MKRNGFAQIPVMIGLLIVAVAVPVATKLVQQNQENRGQAREAEGCKYCAKQDGKDRCLTRGGSCSNSSNECSKDTDCHSSGTQPTNPPATRTCALAYEDRGCGAHGCASNKMSQLKTNTNCTYTELCSDSSKCTPATQSTVTPTKVPTSKPTIPAGCVPNSYTGKYAIGCSCSTNDVCASGYCGDGKCAKAGCNANEICVQDSINCLNGTIRGGQGICKTTTGGILNQTVDGICCKSATVKPTPIVPSSVCSATQNQGSLICKDGVIFRCAYVDGTYKWYITDQCAAGFGCKQTSSILAQCKTCLDDGESTINVTKCCSNKSIVCTSTSGTICGSSCPTSIPTGTSTCVSAGGTCYDRSRICCPGSYCSSSRICVSNVGAGTPVPTMVTTCGKQGFRCCSSGTKCANGLVCGGNFCILPSCDGGVCTYLNEGKSKCTGSTQYICDGSCWNKAKDCGAAGCGTTTCKTTTPTPTIGGPGGCSASNPGIVNTFSCGGQITQIIANNYKCSSVVGRQCASNELTKLRRNADCSCDIICESGCTGGGVGTTGTSSNPTPTSGSTGTSVCTQCAGHSDLKVKGDADCSGITTINDFSVWKSEYISGNFGGETKNSWNADFNCDGKVTLNDGSIWTANFIKGLTN